MKIIRFKYKGSIVYAVIAGEIAQVVNGSIYGDHIKFTNISIDTTDIKPLAPVAPGKVVCVGLNYKDHAKELDMPIPGEPVIFLKPPTSVIGPSEEIVYPPAIKQLDYEAELAVVIRKKAKDIPQSKAADYILGYTCLNDITARDIQKKDAQWTRAKSFDTFCPIGPYIVSGIDPDNLDIELLVNKKMRQSSNTRNQIFNVNFLVSFISHIMTLLPGDVIATGTPKGVGSLSKGDEVEVRIDNIGSLKNTVV